MVDPNKNDDSGWVPLHMAAEEGQKEVAEILIESGADLNKCNNREWAPLHIAAERGQKEVTKLLIN